jgi:hypothetical protein
MGGGGFNIGVSLTHTPYLGFLQSFITKFFSNWQKKKKKKKLPKRNSAIFPCDNLFLFCSL